jgi:organic radical activating enzyme
MAFIDTDAFSTVLRERGVDLSTKRVLVTDLHGSQQEQDLSAPTNCDGLGRLRHFRLATSPHWPENPLPIRPAARALGILAPAVFGAQVFQNAVCNWRCWYCFVDFALLAGNPKHSRWVSAADLVDLYMATEQPAPMIDLSGGQPDLVPEWVAWMLGELRARGLTTYVWSDDNLSNDYFFTKLSAGERSAIESDESYGKVCCFKGFDAESFSFNTKADPELFARQFALMSRQLNETPLDLYAYVTFTTPESNGVAERMKRFVDRLQELNVALPLRTVPLEITIFTPVAARMTETHERALAVQQEAIAAWNEEIASRFSREERELAICDVQLRR